jgi:hypothetical protein
MSPGVLLVALLAAPPLDWLSLGGTGLLTLRDAATLPAGRLSVAFTLDNRDRDPLGLDLLDGSLAWTLGLAPNLESYGRAVVSRVAALPELPALPPPPLDLVQLGGAPLVPRPHYALYPETPYVNKRGSARFDDWVPGDALLGLKRRFSEASAWRPALAACLEVKVPLTRRLDDLQSGAGTGAIDLGGRAVAEWRHGADAWVGSLGYTWTGRPPRGDRLIAVTEAAGPVRIEELPLRVADRLEAGLGWRRRLSPRLAVVLEVVKVVDVGGRTPVLDQAPPLDLLGGVQVRWGRARLAAGLRYHGDSLETGSVRPSPLAGLIDVTDVAEADLARFLESQGARSALAALRGGSQRVVAARGSPALPEGARRLPESYRLRSEHQVGFVVVWGWAF